MNDDALARMAYAEGRAESENLKARRPFDLAVALIEECQTEAARVASAVSDLKRKFDKVKSTLPEVKKESLEKAEVVGAKAAAKVPKVRRAVREKPAVDWCHCGFWNGTPHVHKDHEEEASP